MAWERSTLRKVGNRFVNKEGDWATLIDDLDYKNVVILFDSGTLTEVPFSCLKNSSFNDWMKLSVHGVGYLGAPRKQLLGYKPLYRRWAAMIQRCYEGKGSSRLSYRSYNKVYVCQDWLSFYSFKCWYTAQNNWNKPNWQLDKDLLSGGKGYLYSPEYCVLLPTEINSNIKHQRDVNPSKHGLGVVFVKGKYLARMRRDGYKSDRLDEVLGEFSSAKEAAQCYKMHKEAYVKELAEKWKDDLHPKAYSALLNWKIKETKEVTPCAV